MKIKKNVLLCKHIFPLGSYVQEHQKEGKKQSQMGCGLSERLGSPLGPNGAQWSPVEHSQATLNPVCG